MTVIHKWIIMALAALTIVLGAYWYVSTTQAEIKKLKLSEERYKSMAEQNAAIANNNVAAYQRQLEINKTEQQTILSLQKKIGEVSKEQTSKEVEVTKYVATLPEGFEKSCLDMVVNPAIGRLQQ